MRNNFLNKRITRRDAISTGAKIGIGVAAGIVAGSVGTYFASSMISPPTPTVAKKGYLWGDSPYVMTDEWYIALNRALVYYAQYVGDTVLTLDPRGSQESQNKDIRYMLAQGVDGIMGCPCTEDGAVAVIEEAVNKGVPVVTYDGSANTKKISISILVDNFKIGQQLAEEYVKIVEKQGRKIEGTVFVMRDVAENPVQMARARGFIEIIKKYGVNVLEFTGYHSVETGKKATTEAILAHGVPDLIMSTDLNKTLGAVEALKSLEKAVPRGKEGHIPVIGIDSSPSIMPLIGDGLVDLVMDQPNLFYGALALKCLRIIKEQGERALPEIGQRIISDPTKKLGPQSDGSYNLFVEDIETPKGVRPFKDQYWAPTVCAELHGHRWIVCRAVAVTPENYKTIPVWSNVVEPWFYG
ncbi:MAG: sugar ABC transporter substrate-binding protein [Aigarchaeota archaeon]|nr:sugar ABC transporter substrate-binding protein [Aigarchaeota archaeon]